MKDFSFFLKSRSKTGVLLIHGFTGSPEEMRPLGDYLKKKRLTVYCPVLPGHCTSVRNLEKVSWINSTGLGILISGYTSVRRGGGDLVIMHASDRIESILYVTKLNLLFKAYETEDAALASFAEKTE